MVRLFATLALLLLAPAATLAQTAGPNTRVYSGNDDRQRQRYVCVVPAPRSADRSTPSVCRASEGRVGGRCRCDNVTGSGTLQLGR